ncbi:hypothetical protein Tco_1508447 [Tanacetum coccineum]
MVYTGDDGQALFTSHAWRRLFKVRGPLVREFILEFLSTCRMSDIEMGLDVADTLCFQLGEARRRMTLRQFILALGLHTEEEMAEAGFGAYWSGSERVIPDKGDLRDYWIEISSDTDFLGPAPLMGQAPEKVTSVDLFYLRSMDRGTTNVLYLLAQYLFRHAKRRKSGARLSGGHFIRHLMAHFGLVSDQGLRGLSMVSSELPLIDLHELRRLNICLRFGDTWAWVAPGPRGSRLLRLVPQPSPPAPQHCTMSQRIERLREEAFDSTLVGSSGVPYQRHVKPRTGDASTSTAPHTIKSGSKFNKHSSLIDYKLKISTNLCMKHVLTIKLMEKSVEAEEKNYLVGLLLLVKVRRSLPYIVLHPNPWLNSNEDVIELYMSIPSLRPCMYDSAALLVCNYGVICEDMLKGALFGAQMIIFEDFLFLPNTPYPEKKIRCISAWTSQENAHSQFLIRRILVPSYAVSSWIDIQRFGE